MDTRQDELNRFKSEINLSEFAASYGYELDRAKSSRNSAVMRKGDDKIIIARAETNHYIYFSRHDDRDNGTIIDFIQNRTGKNLGEIRKELRPWIGEGRIPTPEIRQYQKSITITQKDQAKVIQNFATFKEINTLPYLNWRGIPDDVINDPRFKGRIFRDQRRNAIFPHFNETGLCGYEIKNKNYTGFASGGEKTVWVSQCFKGDKTLVFTESAIEALSHFTLYRNPEQRYVSISGSWSEEAEEFMMKIIKAFKGENLLLAFNNDEAGHDLAEKLRAAIAERKLHQFNVLEVFPDTVGYDWNDILRANVPIKKNQLNHAKATGKGISI